MTALTGRAVMQKDARYENRKLLDLCQSAPCMLHFDRCTGGTSPDAPSVPCHSNSQSDGRGMNYKTHDHSAVPGCPNCSYDLDYGKDYDREFKLELFREAQRRWWTYLWRNSLVKVA